MKPSLLLFLTLFTLMERSYCQTPINVCEDCNNLIHDFDFNSSNDSTFYFFYFDSLQVNNIWQVGHVDKNIFTSGYYGPRALVTDSVNPYPPNIISSFQFSVKNCSLENNGGCGAYMVCYISVEFKINSDSLLDGGTIEVSHNGSPFVNIIEDDLASIGGDIYSINDTVSSLNKPGYSGTSSNWQGFGISYERTSQGFDTITLRFTFSSDAIHTNKDGWMIGFIQTGGIFEGLATIFKKDMIKIHPNPSKDFVQLSISDEYKNGNLAILSETGQLIKKIHNATNNEMIDVTDFPDGFYILQYCHDKYFTIEKFIKKN